jgi:hypothetical protein
MGCGVTRRPDGLMELKTDEGMVKLILEIDEDDGHMGNTPECEIGRLHEMRDRDGDALYVVRYNPDAEAGLEVHALDDLAERLIEIIDSDHKKAFESPTLIHVEYIGYRERRIDRLIQTEIDLQTQALRTIVENCPAVEGSERSSAAV